MGASFSCPGADYDALEDGFDGVIVRSFSFDDDGVKRDLRSISFNGRDSEPTTILKSLGTGNMFVEGSVSFKRREMETMISIRPPSEMENNVFVKSPSFKNKQISNQFLRSDSFVEIPITPVMKTIGIPKHEAALKLQKVYKSFRTRRKLADCAVLVEQRWWKLLDFAELKRTSVSFFDIEKPETAVSRWSRARTRVAKVGKGLSKDEKAQKLALQHWLEAIDPRHRYGHNLHFYYVTWLHCESQQPFFYWLDIGDGKEVNLVDKCPRSKLQQQCIKYLGPIERKDYEVTVENGKFMYKYSRQILDTSEGSEDAKWIFVLSTSKTLYVGQKSKGKFQHSSFLAGGATSAAGRLEVENGILKAVWPHSGHYRPTEQNFLEFIAFLKDHNVDLTDVKKSPTDDDQGSTIKLGLTSYSSESDLTKSENGLEAEDTSSDKDKTKSSGENTSTELNQPKSKPALHFRRKLTSLEIPQKPELFIRSKGNGLSKGPSHNQSSEASQPCGYETAEDSFDSEEDEDYMCPKRNLFEGEQEEDEEETIPQESILRRINSKKNMKSYQLGKQLSCKWTTGAGPRIGCVRDYPSELQFRVLEEVSLSPRSARHSRLHSSPSLWPSPRLPMPPKILTPTPLLRESSGTTKSCLR
ncbi:Iq domain-containing protein iqm2 [Thalictrum thalictroides]|uniref:Iq domain-containing protein iqm2 n=1 Tax=Thalictrum thalictroides TaxID=46969 RepID=A0A7J6WIQ4_THATH|nr:Iq domain-containing protein iqm2 [Thalictrum thalictroides]